MKPILGTRARYQKAGRYKTKGAQPRWAGVAGVAVCVWGGRFWCPEGVARHVANQRRKVAAAL